MWQIFDVVESVKDVHGHIEVVNILLTKNLLKSVVAVAETIASFGNILTITRLLSAISSKEF